MAQIPEWIETWCSESASGFCPYVPYVLLLVPSGDDLKTLEVRDPFQGGVAVHRVQDYESAVSYFRDCDFGICNGRFMTVNSDKYDTPPSPLMDPAYMWCEIWHSPATKEERIPSRILLQVPQYENGSIVLQIIDPYGGYRTIHTAASAESANTFLIGLEFQIANGRIIPRQ